MVVTVAQTLYNRTVSIMRSRTPEVVGGTQQVGLVNYSGEENEPGTIDPAGWILLYSNIPCVIDASSAGRTRNQWLPSDVVYKPMYKITIDPAALPQFSVRDRDLLTDDEGYRYSVGQNTWTALGYQLMVVRLET